MRFKSLNDGTKGFRFNIAGVQGFCRKRGHENARCLKGKLFGITKGKTTIRITLLNIQATLAKVNTIRSFTFGKRSLYIEKRNPNRSFWNLTAA